MRIDAYNFGEKELTTAIEKLLDDKELKQRLATASNRITNSDCLLKVSEIIEKLVK